MKITSLNFGSIKDTVFRFSSSKIINEGQAKNFINNFTNEIKKNPILKIQYLIYKNIENGNFKKEYLAERYLNQNLDLISKYSWNDILKENKDFRIKILNNLHVEANSKNSKLYESIHTLIKSKTQKDFMEIDEENSAYEFVVDYLISENVSYPIDEEKIENHEFPNFLSWKYVTELAINNLNKRYSHLNENEKDLIKILTSNSDYKINYLKDLKEENLIKIEELLKEAPDGDVVESLNKFKYKIQNINENENTEESIINLYELKLNLSN